MSLLKDRVHRERQERLRAEKEVEGSSVRPTATEQEWVADTIEKISSRFKERISNEGLTQELQQEIRSSVKQMILDLPIEDYTSKMRIEKVVLSSMIGLGPLEEYMNMPDISEIIVQRYNHITIERNGRVEDTDVEFVSEEHLVNVINRIIQPVGRQINLHMPMVDARLPDGSRVNAVIPPISPDGALLTIRRFPEKTYTGEDYLSYQSLNEEMLYFLSKSVEGRASMLVSGGTGSGKTTLLNMLSSYIPPQELIITIEDSCELRLNQPNVRRLEARIASVENEMLSVGPRALVKNAMRMRPDRIIVGEIRDGTVVDMISAMSTGHEGSLSSVHANSPANLINSRLPILYSMYGDANFTPEAQAIQISEALDLIIHVSRLPDGSRKITHITHVAGLDHGRILLKDIFVYDEHGFHSTGYVPRTLLEKLKQQDVYIDTGIFEKTKRGG